MSIANEEKAVVPLKISAEVCAHNILVLARGQTNLKTTPA